MRECVRVAVCRLCVWVCCELVAIVGVVGVRWGEVGCGTGADGGRSVWRKFAVATVRHTIQAWAPLRCAQLSLLTLLLYMIVRVVVVVFVVAVAPGVVIVAGVVVGVVVAGVDVWCCCSFHCSQDATS